MKRAVALFAVCIIAGQTPTAALAQELESEKWGDCAQTPGQTPDGQPVIGSNGTAYIKDWNELKDENVVRMLLSRALREGLQRCPTGNSVGYTVYQRGMNWTHLLGARWSRASGQWQVSSNIGMFAKREEQKIARERAQAARREQEALKREEMARLKSAALADCGTEAAISGGPWFSSTYKIAARDAARNAAQYGYLCVKTVEYISAAPNPFGGNAARIRISGYGASGFKPAVRVVDIPY